MGTVPAAPGEMLICDSSNQLQIDFQGLVSTIGKKQTLPTS